MHLRTLVGLTVLAAVALATPASAITAGDVLERMSRKQQFGYITGVIDMIIYLQQVPTRGPTTRSDCMLKWYYGKDAPGPEQVVKFFDAHRDKSAPGLIAIFSDRACGAKP